MNQERVSKFIKDLRKKNNLTQKDLADRYNVTYQAVSKWETGKNIPDISLLKQMSKDYNVSLDEILDGSYNKKNKRIIIYVILAIMLIILIVGLILLTNNNRNDYKFKTLSSKCDSFNISGSIAYNEKKSSIYIDNVEYCGDEYNIKFKKIECILYESSNDIEKKINSYRYSEDELITLDEFLDNVTFMIDNYTRTCNEFSSNNLYIRIEGIDENGDMFSHKIPLKLNETCPNK